MLTGQDVDERIVTMQKSVQTGKVKKPKCFYHPENEKYSPPAEEAGEFGSNIWSYRYTKSLSLLVCKQRAYPAHF